MTQKVELSSAVVRDIAPGPADKSVNGLAQRPEHPPLIEEITPAGAMPIVILCDHAGRHVPDDLAQLGLPPEILARHIGWDIGAADVTRRLAERLGAHALLNHVSRLVVDANRRPYTPGSMPPVSDDCVIPGNAHLELRQQQDRLRRFFLPYHRRVARILSGYVAAGQVPLVIAMHSFTPQMSGEDRPWHIGVLWRGDRRVAEPLLAALRAQTGLVIGDNQPYSGYRGFGYTINFHAQRPHFPHVMFELRQDEIATQASAYRYADLLADLMRSMLDDPGLYALYQGDNLSESGGLTSWREASLISP